jgi:predicted nucleic acid-binding protein
MSRIFVDTAALIALGNRRDKSWGLVDCSGILVARKLGITTVFTADHHFTQAGFKILLQD